MNKQLRRRSSVGVRMNRAIPFVLAVALLGAGLGCGVRIQTGPASEEQQTERAEVTGKDQRISWKNRFDGASQRQRVVYLKFFIDSTSANYFQYGMNIADEWRKGEEGRKAEISADEMRQTIDNSIANQRPVLEANDDVVDYAMGRIKEDAFFDRATMDIISQLRDGYFSMYDVVFLPNGTREEYLDRLYAEQSRLQNLSKELEDDLGRY